MSTPPSATPSSPFTTTVIHTLLPHPPYAEDQPLSHTLLTTHVLHHGLQAGSLIGLLTSSTSVLYRTLRPENPTSTPNLSPPWRTAPPLSSSAGSAAGEMGAPSSAHSYDRLRALHSQSLAPTPLARILRGTGTGALVGTAVLGVALTGRMWGREEIEWQDRAWRLLENEGQMGVDVGSVGGMVGGLVVLGVGALRGRGVRGGGGRLGVRGVVGAMGVGSLGGVGAWMGYRSLNTRGGGGEGVRG